MNLRVALELGRVSNLPTVWTNVLAGVFLAGASPSAPEVLILCFTMSLFYTGGMYLNDAFDRQFDAEKRPERPIPSRKVTALAVFAWGFGMLGAGLAVLAAAPLWSSAPVAWAPLVSGAVLAGLIVFYDVYHKQNPLSPFFMGLCRVFVYITAAACVARPASAPVIEGAVLLLAYLIGLTYVARQENLTEIKRLWPLAFLFVPFLRTAPRVIESASLVAAVLFTGFLVWVARAIALLKRRAQKTDIPRAVVSLIAGISLLDGLLVAISGRPAAAFACVLGFALTRFLQRYISGT